MHATRKKKKRTCTKTSLVFVSILLYYARVVASVCRVSKLQQEIATVYENAQKAAALYVQYQLCTVLVAAETNTRQYGNTHPL
jgi:flagellar basal body-associated protein FliL